MSWRKWWRGKAWTALAHAESYYDSLMEAAALDAARTDPSLVLMGEEPHLVDEWQKVPAIWDAARNHIDRNGNRKGELILTGSARPKDEGKVRHSGTGRIARLRMRPMALCESDPACMKNREKRHDSGPYVAILGPKREVLP